MVAFALSKEAVTVNGGLFQAVEVSRVSTSLDSTMSRLVVVLASTEMKVKMSVAASSWMDWWLHAAKSLLLANSSQNRYYQLFLARASTQMMMARTALVLWVNLVLKCQD